MSAFIVTLHYVDAHTQADMVRRPFDALSEAVRHGLPLEGVDLSKVHDTWVESVEKVPDRGWSIVMRVSADRFKDAVPVAAVAARNPHVNAVSLGLGDAPSTASKDDQ